MASTVPARLEVRRGPVSLYAEAWGEGEIPLVLGHGFGGSARNFRPQARELARERRFVLFDARGHARSSAPDEADAYEPAELVADLGAVLDAAGAERAIVGGLSMGAGVALRFALAHPERVAGLLLTSFPRTHRSPGHVEWAEAFARDIDALGIERAGEIHAWGSLLMENPKGADMVRRGFLEHRPEALAHLLRRLLAVQPSPADLCPELARLRCPTLVVLGSADRGSSGPTRSLAQCIPGARLVEIAGGHVINLENPLDYNRELASWLATLPPHEP